MWVTPIALGQVPKAADGHPDLSGIWQALGTANWELVDHQPEPGPFYQLGALGVPPGRGVVEGGDIPYKPEALAQRKQNSANRVIEMGKPNDPSVDTWMGTANGRWEGGTLVVDNCGFNDLSWLDRSGNYHSGALHVIERYTLVDREHIRYEATIEDAKVYTRPWKIAPTLYRDVEPNATLPEFKCVEMTEELLYRDLNGPGAK